MAALYVHVPFRPEPRPSDAEDTIDLTPPDDSRFVEALTEEIDRYRRSPYADATISTVYVGGGRPSLLSPEAVRSLFDALKKQFEASAIGEVTFEVRPSDVSLSYLQALRQVGVTRLSIEARSFDPPPLTALEAAHSSDEVLRTIRLARRVGVESFSVDLPLGGAEPLLPTWKASLHQAVELGVPHVTLHELQRDGDDADAEDERAECLAFAMTFFRAKGYEQYELTHFARPGHRSRYQEQYYAHENVLGLGPGAESFWWPDRTQTTSAQRWSNVRTLSSYVERLAGGETPVAHRETLDRRGLAREYVLLRLRTIEGLDLNRLESRYGVSLRDHHGALLDRLAREGLIRDASGSVRLTDRGRLLTDALTQRLLPS